MKVLILLALVASLNAAWWTTIDETVTDSFTHTKYEAGKEYVYKFESQVLTGLPAFTRSYGGIKIKADVKLDFMATEGVMQLSECQPLTINHEVSDPVNLPPWKQLPADKFSSLPYHQVTLIKTKLEIPMKFRYVEGKITWIEVADEETNWSIDLKRSILSMLQVRLQTDDTTLNPELEYNDLEKENSTTFSFLEPALDGTCYSTVSVKHSPQSTAEDSQYKIMKSRDPKNCAKLNTEFKVTWPQDISNCRCDPNMEDKMCVCTPVSEEYTKANPAYFDAKTLTEYKVKSTDGKNFLIQDCFQTAVYRYEFPNTPDQYMATYSNQTLKLTQQKSEQSIDYSRYTFKRSTEPWKYQILKEDEEKLMLSSEQVVQQAKQLVDEMFSISNDRTRFDDHLTVFYQLVENLRLCKKNQLDELFRENDVTQQYKKWKVLVDAMAHCNTTVCDEFLMDKIASGIRYFPANESTTVFMLWATNKVPTIPVLEKFSSTVLPALEGKSEQKMAYHHALLCFGSMINRFVHNEHIKKHLCALEKDKLIHQKHIEDCRKYEQVLENKLSSASTDEEKIHVLKSLSNLGSLESLPKIQKMMEKTETTAVRVHAVYAVRHLCYQNRMKVLRTVTPLLMNVNEDSEVRMAAFIMSLLCDPSTAQLHKVIEQEPDLDLKTFFVKTLQNELKYPIDTPNYKRAQKAKMVLSRVSAFQMSANSGNLEVKFGMRPEFGGEVLNWAWLTNQTSPFPRTAALKHINIIRKTGRDNLEMGYRAEGFEALFGKISDKAPSQTSHPDVSILDALAPTSRSWNKEEFKPTLTLYIRADDQHVAVVHVDTETITKHMLSAVRHGQMEIPIKVFQTYVFKPEQNKKLQPHGMWQVTEHINMGVFDIDGTLIIRKPAEGELMPNISFGSEKMFRHEKKTILSQYVKCGFAKAGITSALLTRQYISEQLWNVSYSFSQKNMTFNVSNPTNDILRFDIKAYTNSFVVPMRVPDIVKQKDAAFRDIVTVDPHRVTFNKEVDAFKSVELKAKVEGDICVPELYTFVRDRLHLLPSMLSIKKQDIKFSINPATSSWRNYTFTQSWRDLRNEKIAEFGEETTGQQDTSVESEDKDWGLGKIFANYFSSSDDAKNEIKSLSSDKYDPLKQLRTGSIRTLWQGKIWSRSERQTLAMVANFTTQYEHDYPTVHYVMSCERPPIPSMERDRVVFRSVATKVFNPSINQILSKWSIAWGEKSDPTKKTIEINDQHTAMYKDNVCVEQSAYGCKDQYGVFYPLSYNETTVFKSENNDLVAWILRTLKPIYWNSAEKVSVLPANKQIMEKNEINMTRIYRAYDYKVDVAFTLDEMHWNMSKVYLPLEKSLEDMFLVRPMYPLGEIRPVASFLPGHEQVDPFFSRDTCVVENTRVMSMDFKHLIMPKSDCEVVLIGDCARENKQLMVTLKPEVSERTVEKKTLKVIFGSSKIEIELAPRTSFMSSSLKIKINGQERYLDANKRLLVKEQQKTVAVVECSDEQCEIKSGLHGLYVRVNGEKVKVELDNGRSRYMCGICSAHPELRSAVANYNQSVEIFKKNRKQNEQCDIPEKSEDASRFYEQETCSKIHKHKMINMWSGGKMKVCVTNDKLPLCRHSCKDKSIRFDYQPLRCVSQEEAQRLDLTPSMEGNEMYLSNERIIPMMRGATSESEAMPLSQDCA